MPGRLRRRVGLHGESSAKLCLGPARSSPFAHDEGRRPKEAQRYRGMRREARPCERMVFRRARRGLGVSALGFGLCRFLHAGRSDPPVAGQRACSHGGGDPRVLFALGGQRADHPLSTALLPRAQSDRNHVENHEAAQAVRLAGHATDAQLPQKYFEAAAQT